MQQGNDKNLEQYFKITKKTYKTKNAKWSWGYSGLGKKAIKNKQQIPIIGDVEDYEVYLDAIMYIVNDGMTLRESILSVLNPNHISKKTENDIRKDLRHFVHEYLPKLNMDLYFEVLKVFRYNQAHGGKSKYRKENQK